jgi:hypothetical protein
MEQKKQFQVVDAGPIQLRRINKAIDKFSRAYRSFISKHNPQIIMTKYDLSGKVNAEEVEAFNNIGVRFAWWITRQNAPIVQDAFEKAANEKLANLPVEK